MFPGTFANVTPEKAAVIMAGSGQALTYRELDDRSMQLAQLFRDRGIRRGQVVATLSENRPEFFEVYWAAMRSALYFTAVNTHLAAEEAAYIVDNVDAAAFVASSTMAATASAIPVGESAVKLALGGAIAGFEQFDEALRSQPATPLPVERRGELLLFSSGTTGRPKGIKRALADLAMDDPAGAQLSAMERYLLGMNEDSVYLSPAPLYHTAPLGWSTAVHELGGTVVVMETFDAEKFLAAVERHRVTHVQVVPTMFVRLLKLPDAVRTRYDLSSLKAIVHAAAPCPVEVKKAMIDWLGPIVHEYYSGTEGVGFTYIDSHDWLAHPGSVGKPMVGIPHICDEAGAELGTGEAGLLYFELAGRDFEYHGDPEKTAQSRHPDHRNWATLGDIGYVDDDGYLYLTDRKSFTIISGGVNVYPAEIEACLVMHPSVVDVAVFGLPDPEMGEFVQAVVALQPDVEPSAELAEELRTYARGRVAGYKVPRAVDFRDELPRLPTGKLAKGGLRAEYVARLAAGQPS
ncbi:MULTISPECIES: acyl-CoA synthetase [unclassified Mycobacterium]|uniref:acyl-CoA synthetase n=1 Tax=unclassified Mycobacterium TaxID=2642494 RepID=UPI0029C70BF8|nr:MULTISPECIES: acyl-CoA synthetase [unclassified Mycobacterium]